MDLQSQAAIVRLAEANDPATLVVLLGAPDPEAAEIAAETVVSGDPAYAGALAGVQLGLDVYHVLITPFGPMCPMTCGRTRLG